jgi:uncharacterized repeat protein (TIGR01451 family)
VNRAVSVVLSVFAVLVTGVPAAAATMEGIDPPPVTATASPTDSVTPPTVPSAPPATPVAPSVPEPAPDPDAATTTTTTTTTTTAPTTTTTTTTTKTPPSATPSDEDSPQPQAQQPEPVAAPDGAESTSVQDPPAAALVQATVDLSVTMYAPEAASAGAPIRWLLTVGNNGPGTASSFTLTDPIPASVTGVATSTPGCSVAGNLVTCSGGPLAAGGQTSVTITGFTPNVFTFPLVNTATVAEASGDVDSNPGNDSVTRVTTTATPAPSLGLLARAELQDGNANGVGDIGERIDYTFRVSNTGNVTLFDVAVQHDGAGGVVCADTVLSLGESTSCTGPSHTVTSADVIARQVVTTSTATATAPSGTAVESLASHTNVPTFAPAPSIGLVGVAELVDTNGDGLGEAGERLNLRFLVSNTGNVPLTSITVSSNITGTNPCASVTTLQPNQTAECVVQPSYVITAQDVLNGAVVITSTVSGSSSGTTVTSAPSTTSTPTFQPNPVVALSYSATLADQNGNGLGDLGELVELSVTVTNAGNVVLTDVLVNDVVGGVAQPDCTRPQLAPGQSVSCDRIQYHVTAADVAAGAVIGIATAFATAPDSTRLQSVPATINTPVFQPQPVLALVKRDTLVDTNNNGLADLGEAVDYTFTVVNVGNVPLTGLAIVDQSLTGVTCPRTSLAPNDIVVCTSDTPHLTSAADIAAEQVVNSAVAMATAPGGATVISPPSVTNTPTVVAAAALALDKIATLDDLNHNGFGDLGETIQWTFLVVNNGNARLVEVHVDDPVAGPVTCLATTLDVLAVTTCRAVSPHVVTEADILAGEVTNTAVAKSVDPGGAAVVSPPDSTRTPTASVAPDLTLEKSAHLVDLNANELADEGETVDYSFVLTNSGNVTLTSIRVDDPKAGAVTCPVTTLAPGASVTCTAAQYTVTAADIVAGVVRNVAVGSGTPPVGPPVVTPPDTVDVPVADPGLTITKTASLNDLDGDDLADVDETIDYSFVLTNTGNVALTDLGVDDPKAGAVACPVTTLAPGASVTCTAAPYTVTAEDVELPMVHNVATGTGQPPGTDPPIITPPVTADVPTDQGGSGGGGAEAGLPALTVVKSAALADLDGDGLADAGERITYTFLVTNTGDAQLINVAVQDAKISGVVCPLTTLEAGEFMTCTAPTYVVTSADIAAGVVHNVATASGQTSEGGDPIVSPPSEVDVPVTSDGPGAGAGGGASTAGGGGASLAFTGIGMLGMLIGWAMLSSTGGVLLVTLTTRRRKRR